MSLISISNKKVLLILFIFFSKLYSIDQKIIDKPICIYNKNPSNNLVLSLDYLYWFSSQEVASIWADVITIGNNTSSWKADGFNFNWDSGFRVGVGYNFNYDKWDTLFTWTWFETDAEHSIPFESNASISPEFDAAFLSGDRPQSMSAKWSLFLNMFDFELGKSLWITKCFFLRPFLGIKGGFINQKIHAKYYDLIINHVSTNDLALENLKNNFSGIGPLLGFSTKWRVKSFVYNFFDIFGDFSIATMWGDWVCKDFYKNSINRTSSVNMKDSKLGAFMFKGFMGLEWDLKIKKSCFTTKLGYEMQIWLNQLRIATFQLQRLHNDLTLQGITLNCRLDF